MSKTKELRLEKDLEDLKPAMPAYQSKDFATAFSAWLPLAEQGNVLAQKLISSMYHYGNGVSQNYVDALKWLTKAAQQGNVDAQHNLGLMYEIGIGAPQDFVLACKWFILAAVQGNEEAMEAKDKIQDDMTLDQIAEAQKLASGFITIIE